MTLLSGILGSSKGETTVDESNSFAELQSSVAIGVDAFRGNMDSHFVAAFAAFDFRPVVSNVRLFVRCALDSVYDVDVDDRG